MNDDTKRAGLGKVIYSVDDPAPKEDEQPVDERVDDAEVQEAAEESFPASDPPGYGGGSSSEPV